MNPEYRKLLTAELARIDQQIADTEALTDSECDDATLKLATEMLAEARQIRKHFEEKLRAESGTTHGRSKN